MLHGVPKPRMQGWAGAKERGGSARLQSPVLVWGGRMGPLPAPWGPILVPGLGGTGPRA